MTDSGVMASVFVYGTLLRGERNQHWMRGAVLLGRAVTPRGYSLWSLGQYPVACPFGGGRIRGEVYRLNLAGLYRLDVLEEYPRYYRRRLLRTSLGLAWIYYQDVPPAGARRLPGGDWRRGRPRIDSRRGFQGVEAVQGRQVDGSR